MNPSPLSASLAHLRVVLVRTSHPGNIGSAARAMKTMGLARLVLVAPKRFPDSEATALASGAADVLENASIVATLEAAVADCVAAYALSARPRIWSPEESCVRDAAGEVLDRAAGGPVALVFGNEASGLTNAELLACQAHVRIPANPEYSSLNLAQAVQVVCYELRMAALAGGPLVAQALPPATVGDLEGLYAELENASVTSGFLDPDRPGYLRARWRRLFSRARLEREEVNILRGLLRALQRPGNDST